MSQSTPLPPLLRLPTELQLDILAYLPLIDQAVAAQVCVTFRSLLSTKTFAQQRYLPVGISDYLTVNSESLRSTFLPIHFLIKDWFSDVSVLVCTVKGRSVVSYNYFSADSYTEHDGELWNGDMKSLDLEIKDALKQERNQGSLEEVQSISDKPRPGDLLDIDNDEWNDPTVFFFSQGATVSRLAGGIGLNNYMVLDEPFISPFIDVQPPPSEAQEMKFKFELSINKDRLLDGSGPVEERVWDEKMVFKRDATVRDWVNRFLEKALQAEGRIIAEDETFWVSIQIGRLGGEDGWKVTAAIWRVSKEAMSNMVWVRRKDGKFLLIKRALWDQRASWRLDEKEGTSNGHSDGLEAKTDNATA